jgi:putative transposase
MSDPGTTVLGPAAAGGPEEHAQRFLEPFSAVYNHVRPRRHLLPAEQYRQMRTERFQQWQEATRLQPVA